LGTGSGIPSSQAQPGQLSSVVSLSMTDLHTAVPRCNSELGDGLQAE